MKFQNRYVWRTSLAGIALTFAFSHSAEAALVTVDFDVNIMHRTDVLDGSTVDIVPITGRSSFSFDNVVTRVRDLGFFTYTWFGKLTWRSPVASYLPGPESGLYGPSDGTLIQGAVTDFSPSIFGEYANAGEFSHIVEGDITRHSKIYLSARKISPGRNHDGTSDYAFTSTSILDFYREFETTGAPLFFAVEYFTMNNENATYLDHTMYWGDTARITKMTISTPEPGTALLLIPALGVVLGRRIFAAGAKQ